MKYFAAILVLAACAYAQEKRPEYPATSDESRPARAAIPFVGAYPTAYITGSPAGYVHPGAAYVPTGYPSGYPAYIAPAATLKTAQYQYVSPHAAYVPNYVVPQPAYYPAGVKAIHV